MVAKPVFFQMDPESVHDGICRLGTRLGSSPATRRLFRSLFAFHHPMLEQTACGIRFANPVGLAAGFDKNGVLIQLLPSVGFGFEEIGSITGEPCQGNPRPRLWRLPKSKGLVVHYGLRNDGCEAIARRLHDQRRPFPLGVSIAKTNSPSTAEAAAGIADYAKAYVALSPIADYLTINISCPNAFGGEPFTDPARLETLLAALDAIPSSKPMFLKMPADMTVGHLDAVMEVAAPHRVQGLIFSNLTKDARRPEIHADEARSIPRGGIGGRPVFAASNELLAHAFQKSSGRFVLIGCGGVFSAEDAYQKIRLGATLVQLISGMVFEGPQLIGEINRGLTRLLARDGFSCIKEAIGSAHRSRATSP